MIDATPNSNPKSSPKAYEPTYFNKLVYYTPAALAVCGTVFTITRAAIQLAVAPQIVIAGAVAGVAASFFFYSVSVSFFGCPCCGAYAIYIAESALASVAAGIVVPLINTDPAVSGFCAAAMVCTSLFMHVWYNYRGEGSSKGPLLFRAMVLGEKTPPSV